MRRRSLFVLFLVALTAICIGIFTACGGNEQGETSITLTPTAITVVEGSSTQVTAQTSSESQIEWSIDNASVAEVNMTIGKLCVVKGKAAGSATLTATVDGQSATCAVTVTSKEDEEVVNISYNNAAVTGKLTVEQQGTLQLSAVGSKGSQVTEWTSSNSDVATVSSTGLVTALFPGKTTVTARVNSSLKAEVEIEVTAKAGSVAYKLLFSNGEGTHEYNPATGQYDGENEIQDNTFFYWASLEGWNGRVDVNKAQYQDGVVDIDYFCDWNPGHWASFQLFYRNTTLTEGKTYKLTCKINSTAGGMVTFNNNVIELKQGDNNVELYFVYTGGVSSFTLIMGVNNHDLPDSDINRVLGSCVEEAVLKITDVVWTEDTQVVKLSAPTFTLSGKTINITDPNAAGVGGYQLGFYQGGELKGTVNVENGKEVNTGTMAKGTYTVKLKAVAENVHYLDSDYSAGTAEMTVTEDPSYTLPDNGITAALSNPGIWAQWHQWYVAVDEASYDKGTVTLTFSNNLDMFDTMQLYYKSPENVAGTTYKMTFELELIGDNGGSVTINGTVVELKEGKHTYTVGYTETASGASFAMLVMTQEILNEIPAATIKISNLVFEEARPEPLEAPTFAIGANNVITVTDSANAAENVDGYTLGFFKEGASDPSYKVNVVSGEAVNLDTVLKGTYTVRLKANGKGELWLDSAWSETTAQMTSTTEKPLENIEYGENGYTWAPGSEWGPLGAVTQNPGKWFYWNDKNTNGSNVSVSSATLSNDVVEVVYSNASGKNSYGLQLFYDCEENVAGEIYKVCLDLTSTIAVKVKVNGTEFDLEANVLKHVEVNFVEPEVVQYAGASIVIQVGVDGAQSGKITVANMTMGAGTAQEGGEDDGNVGNGEESGSVTAPGKWIEWHDHVNWCGSEVAVADLKVENKVVSGSYSVSAGACAWGFQLFYTCTAAERAEYNQVTWKITLSKSMTIEVGAGVSEAFVANTEKEVTVPFRGAGAATLKLVFPVTEGDNVTFSVAYTLGKGEQTGGNAGGNEGGEQNENAIAYGENGYTWAAEGWGPLGAVTQNPGKWFYWNDKNTNGANVTVSSATFTDGVVEVVYSNASGKNSYGVQLFYDYEGNVAGSKYKLSLDITSEIATTVNINGTDVTLEANVLKHVEVSFTEPEVVQYAGASIVIQVAVDGAQNGKITVKNVQMVADDGASA